MSFTDRMRQSPRYDPMRRRAGDTTMWFISLVGHTCDMTQKNASSEGPGQVLELVKVGPFDNPRVRFFCMSFNFSRKCSADVMG